MELLLAGNMVVLSVAAFGALIYEIVGAIRKRLK